MGFMQPLTQRWLMGLTAFLAVMFAVFAYVQINDLDPAVYHKPSLVDAWSWVIFYGLLAVLFVVSIFRRVPKGLLVVAALFCAVEMVRTAPGLFSNLFEAEQFTMTGAAMAASRSEVELSREFFGALIGLLGVAFLWWQAVTPSRRTAS
jgi:uncharacterized membrane protein